jgi:hypothetical protein
MGQKLTVIPLLGRVARAAVQDIDGHADALREVIPGDGQFAPDGAMRIALGHVLGADRLARVLAMPNPAPAVRAALRIRAAQVLDGAGRPRIAGDGQGIMLAEHERLQETRRVKVAAALARVRADVGARQQAPVRKIIPVYGGIYSGGFVVASSIVAKLCDAEQRRRFDAYNPRMGAARVKFARPEVHA